MSLRAIHTTTYLYSAPVSACHTETRLSPRQDRNQRVLTHQLYILPAPEETLGRKDYFGNEVTYFSIQEPHQILEIRAISRLEMSRKEPPDPLLTPAWEETLAEVRLHADASTFEAYEFTFESPRIPLGPEFAAYASVSFTNRRPLLEASLDLCHRIYTEFEYDQRATDVTTSVVELLESRRGVCQDFAHFTIACLRSLGLPARYVSGYLGSSDLVGIGASHAWVSILCPGFGWLSLDPTNDQMAQHDYVTLAWGRDYSDVAPVKGIVIGGGDHFINVSVEVTDCPD